MQFEILLTSIAMNTGVIIIKMMIIYSSIEHLEVVSYFMAFEAYTGHM